MKRIIAFLGLILLIGVAAWGVWIVRSFNHFEEVRSSFNGQCQAVTGIAGPEDIQFDGTRRKAFISSYNRRAKRDDRKRGAIHLFDIHNPLEDSSWYDRTKGVPENFAPQGIHFFEGAGVKRLFVVNEADNAVEIYDVDGQGDLAHLETLKEKRLSNPNDIIAVGPRAFYVTNDKYSGSSNILGRLSFLLRQRTGRVLFFNGISWHEAASSIQNANGIALDGNGQKLYVAETAGGNIIEYDRDDETGYLTFSERIRVGAAVDNINIDEEGLFLIGAHPQPLALARHRRDKDILAPSRVYTFDPKTKEVSTLYSDDGASLSGSSVAARSVRKLIIGSLYEEKFLICDMDR